MTVQQNPGKTFLIYLVKFAAAFCACYFGTSVVIGLTAPGGYYNGSIDKYFNYINWLRASLLYASKWVLSVFGYDTFIDGRYLLKMKGGHSVKIVYSCLGVGIMSFWIAFIVANKGTVAKKLKWIPGGLFLIWLINIARISILLAAISNHWPTPYFNHHTWFNIFAYILIFILIYFYDRSSKEKAVRDQLPAPGISLKGKNNFY